MIIRKDASLLRFFAYLVGRPKTPTVAGQAEAASILKFIISFLANSIQALKRIYILFLKIDQLYAFQSLSTLKMGFDAYQCKNVWRWNALVKQLTNQ
ncbi:hypothetical protein [Algoriphagus winogradskyi]|uniref:hypothetical protein n=1 Tax=Algoriphagus winogradskyi TaxID=237017 RepID=UPI0024B6DD53|nr:hypothetical protein [Algoriphagus winogradskyi]